MKPLRLRVEPPGEAPFDHECVGPSLVLGRSSRTDIRVSDRFVSRRHARLFREGDAWLIEGLGSNNPTILNGLRIKEPTRLAQGDVVRVGETLVHIEPKAGPRGAEPEIRSAPSLFTSARTLLQTPEAEGGAGEASVEATNRRLARRLKLVTEVHRALAAAVSLEALLELLLDHAFGHLSPEEAAIFLSGRDGELYRAAHRRVSGVSGEFPFSRSLAREVTEKGLAALVHDALADERFASSESIVRSGVRSIAAAPLLDAQSCLGMIVLTSRAHARRFSEEDLELLVSLASAAASRIRNIALVEDAARHRLLEKEIELAHDIQMGMLPKDFPSRRELELSAALKPARSVGGDLYDFFDDGGRLWLLVGDVSGKGFASALLMAVTKTLFRALAQAESSPAAVLSRMNRELSRDNERAMFVTAFAACLDVASGELTFANAGHNRPYLLAADGSLRRLTDAAGVAMGVVEGVVYDTGRLRLQPGDALYLYTDGVTEALDAGGAQFTEEGLEACLRAVVSAPAAQIVAASLAAVQEFAGSAPQSDDIAVLAVRYLSAP